MNHTVSTSLSNPADRAAAEERLRKKRLADAAPKALALLEELQAENRETTDEDFPQVAARIARDARALLAQIDGRE